MSGNFVWFHTSQERIATVIDDIRAGSEPRLAFYALLVASSLIAGLGLVADSPAVIIGAMLVSPLMTPIFGIGLGMLRADTKLLRRALTAEVVGVILSVGVAFLFGLFMRGVDATPEMLARTEPHLLDLLVAVLAGFAGAYALVDERVSPALPGVAIATAIVPPLSNTGLCLALGAETGAFGSFMLFVANFFAILVVGLLTFAAAGMSPTFRWTEPKAVARQFGLAAAGFLVVAIFLTPPLIHSVRERRTERQIDDVLTAQMSLLPAVALDDFIHDRENGEVHVIANVRSPKVVTPSAVTTIQDELTRALGAPTRLIVRTVMARDVAAVGSDMQAVEPDLDGGLLEQTRSTEEKTVRTAEQVLLEELSAEPGFSLERVELGHTAGHAVLLARIRTMRLLKTEEITRLRSLIRERLDDPTLELIVQIDDSSAVTAQETLLFEWTDITTLATADEPDIAQIRTGVREAIESIPDLFCKETHVNLSGVRCRVLAEVVGPHAPTPEQAAAIQQAVSSRSPREVEVHLWFRADAIVTPDGYASYAQFTREITEEKIRRLPNMFRQIDTP